MGGEERRGEWRRLEEGWGGGRNGEEGVGYEGKVIEVFKNAGSSSVFQIISWSLLFDLTMRPDPVSTTFPSFGLGLLTHVIYKLTFQMYLLTSFQLDLFSPQTYICTPGQH